MWKSDAMLRLMKLVVLSCVLWLSMGGVVGAVDVVSDVAEGKEEVVDVVNNARFGDWIVVCQAVTVSKNVCSLVQELRTSETDDLVVSFLASRGTREGEIFLFASMPLGVFFPRGAVYRVVGAGEGGSDQKEMIWQRCSSGSCEAAIVLTREDMEQFEDEGTILFGYSMSVNAEPVIVSVDVSRFYEAVKSIYLLREKTGR